MEVIELPDILEVSRCRTTYTHPSNNIVYIISFIFAITVIVGLVCSLLIEDRSDLVY